MSSADQAISAGFVNSGSRAPVRTIVSPIERCGEVSQILADLGFVSAGLTHSAARCSMSAWASAPYARRRTSLRAQRRDHAVERRPQPGGGDERLEDRGREVLERVAARQHQRTQAGRGRGGDDLRDRPARVVADQHHVRELEPLEELGHDPGDSLHRDLWPVDHGLGVGAERPGGGVARVALLGQALGQRVATVRTPIA